MSLLMFLIFLIPINLKFIYIIFQYCFMFIYMSMLFCGCYNFMCKLSYFLGLDNFSYMMLLMTMIVVSFMIVSMINMNNLYMYLFNNMFMLIFLFLIFGSLNFLYMYISFEFVLIPLLVLILGWGYQPERLMSGMYLFFYTLIGSFPLFILILHIYVSFGSLFFDYIHLDCNFFLVHFVLTIVFMVKMPMYFVHFWLPSAHVQAPVSGSMILAALMLKIGGYGLIRTMFMYEYMYMYYSFIWFSFSMIGSVFISIICLIQSDMKCLIAYSSVSHMGMVIMGLVSMSFSGLMGSFFLMLGHGFCSSGMFYMANLFYMRSGSRSFYINKGLINYIPSCSSIWFMYCIFNMGCPPSINFISELLILMSMMNFWMGSFIFFVMISFMCACFSYYMYSYSQHGLFNNMYTFSYLNLNELLCLMIHLLVLFVLPLSVNTLF
uniref:NADH-ubiquinone oxidoreductase chain 4 n=1 Tax=Mukaria splendida TaxID=2586309 RepID=A0A7L8ZU45_9HEMI|nr:NADH dehydrogenase subunit 4 [Mukaria splendida]QOI73923.1 NADH dehydrogenase subunit 4 [Mukaria splendida]